MMKYYARFNSTDFKITELPTLNDSSRETKFSDIQIDFTGYEETLLPVLYQEITIVQIDDSDVETVLYIGYLESVDYPEFTSDEQPFLISLSMLSPYAYSTKRTLSIEINNIALNVAILTILDPLLDDGFTVELNQLSTTSFVNEIYTAETVEKMMNHLAGKYNFVWYIDKNKKIYLKDNDLLIGQTPLINITDTNRCYLKSIKPTKTVVDYANKLVIKNVIIIGFQEFLPVGTILIDGETYTFPYPFSISENTCFRLSPEDPEGEIRETYAFSLLTNDYITEDVIPYNITVNLDDKTIIYDTTIGFDGIDNESATKRVLLITDTTDTTKITGFKWKGDTEVIVSRSCVSYSSLSPSKCIFIDTNEIENIKTKVNTSGIIEKIIDANSKYFTGMEIQEYAVNLFSQNNVQTNSINCTFKGTLNDSEFIAIRDNLKITELINVNLPTFKIDSSFIITDLSYSVNTETATITINARNSNLSESYTDIYREPLQQESTDYQTLSSTTFYNQDNKTVLGKEIYVNGVLVNAES